MIRSDDLVRVLERQARALRRYVPAAIAGNDTGVHQARVASRRLREAVPVLTQGLHGSKANKARRKIRRLTRALGSVRELDVTLLVVDELRDRSGMPKAALSELRAHVMEERERRRQTMHERLGDIDLEKLHRRLDSVCEALRTPQAGHKWRSALTSRLVSQARRLDRAIDAAGRIYAPEALHRVRIASKKLRYALEIANDTKAAPSARALRIMKRVQDTLGRLHDLQVLQQHIAEIGADTDSAQAVPDPGLAILARMLEDECRRLHGRYVSLLPQLREIVEYARHDAAVRVSAAEPTPARMTLPASTRERRGAVGPRERPSRGAGRSPA
jgi:CHAD domain-containing protein